MYDNDNKKPNFDGLMVTLASVEDIESWSHGAVDNPDTVNYRTGKPKPGGLFCESIFGPVKNYECSCGKYKGSRYKGIVCEKCNVEVTNSRTRRTRMGHVDLASPLVHAWYKNSPSGGIHQLLQLSSYEIDKILSFVKYIIIKGPDEKSKDFMKKILKGDFNIRLTELDEIFREEDDAEKNAKKKAELKELYEEKKKELVDEQMRLNGIISEIEWGKTVMESDWRSFFYRFCSKARLKDLYENLKKADQLKSLMDDLASELDKTSSELNNNDISQKEKELNDKIDNISASLNNLWLENRDIYEKLINDLGDYRANIVKTYKKDIDKKIKEDDKFKENYEKFEEISLIFSEEIKQSSDSQIETLCSKGFFKGIISEDQATGLDINTCNYLINLSVLIGSLTIKASDKTKIKNIVEKLPAGAKQLRDNLKKLEIKLKELIESNEYKEYKDLVDKHEEIESKYNKIKNEYDSIKNYNDEGIVNFLKEKDSQSNGIEELMEMASGPDGILKALKGIDVEKEIKRRVKEFPNIKSADAKKKSMSLIKLLINLYISGVKPENMVLRKLPVIPPDLRPVVQLDGGRFASSDVNLFYRRVLMRNNRLKKLVQVGMPDVLKKNEIRLLQESVNNLLVGEKAGAGRSGAGNKVFKSLSDMLSGKEGIFRKNLLGKRVDYSGRSVITVGPGLKLDECGLPIYIAVKVFTPFIVGKLMEKKYVYTPKQAEKLIKDEDPIALKFLEEVIKDKYVLLNRAPTLHRLGIEAFKIKLFPGKTIRLHPLVCGSFNADFDGDQMAIHLPISDEAQKEAKELIASDKNVLKPASGDPTLSLSQDMVLGVYYLMDYFDTRRPEINTEEEWSKDVPVSARFASMQEAYKAYENKEIHIKDKILILHNGETIETTAGRVIFNMKMPEGLGYINNNMKSKDIKQLLGRVFDEYGMPVTVRLSDDIKDLGFKYSTLAAVSINILDMKIPQDKEEILREGDKDADVIYKRFYKGFYSEDEKHRLIIDVWTDIKKRVEARLKPIIGAGNNLYTMIDSAARGSQNNVTQICGMKGLVVNPQGEIIELPIKGSFAEGLTPIEYFIAAHSGRKGKADTALRTAESGYLTRKLCDASQEVIIREEDCGSEEYITYSKENAAASGEKFFTQIYGRVLAQDVIDENGVKILDAGIMLGKGEVALIEGNDAVHEVKVRSPITCHCASGVCQKCYGMDLSSRQLVQIGIPVGIIAAQSIGEPSTQLTLNTFHTGGVAGESESDASGIDRIKQLFEVRTPKHPAIIAPFDGTIDFEETPEGGKFGLIKITSEPEKKIRTIKDGYKFVVKKGDNLVKGAIFAERGKSALKVEEDSQVISIDKDSNTIIFGVVRQESHKLFGLLPKKTKSGEKVYAGEILTNGTVNIQEYKKIVGDLDAQRYIIREAKKVYSDQGQSLNDKHMEIIVKQLFSKVFIEDSGDSSFIPGTYVKYEDFLKKNEELAREKKTLAKGQRMALGLTTIAKETDSWLSAASFQETIRVMVGASLRGAIDTLSDLKANVIIGRLLPIGENYRNTHGFN